MKQGPFDFGKLDIDAVNQNRLHGGLQSMVQGFTLTPEYPRQVQATRDVPKDGVTILLHDLLVQYFSNAFFFNPFRHSGEVLPVQQTPSLAQNGYNLAQVLHTINSNDRFKFQEIEQFVHAALPDIGQLQTPLASTSTQVAFRSQYDNYLTRLHDMGGGIEQLLMVATVLLTTGDESTMFVEEPESHLHAGAQRFLLEKLYEGKRQVFITTHSPTYINFSRPHSIYRVSYIDERTRIEQCNDKPDLVLEDIGVRNSDILLSDAVVFVEGPSDRDVINTLSETLGTSFAERNVTPLIMGGGQYAERGAPIRSDVLAGISQKAPIPHLFLLDRDERSQAEISNLQKRPANRVHILAARELENYLLVPRALLAALRTKHQNDAQMLEKLEQTSEEQIEQHLHDIADSLYDIVLLKRIRSEIGGLKDGLLPRQSLANLDTQDPELDKLILKEIKEQVSQRLANIGDIVQSQRKTLAYAWADRSQRLVIAPGEEIIAALFKHFGSQYNKTADAVRIAEEMRKDEIAPELQEVITKVLILVTSSAE